MSKQTETILAYPAVVRAKEIEPGEEFVSLSSGRRFRVRRENDGRVPERLARPGAIHEGLAGLVWIEPVQHGDDRSMHVMPDAPVVRLE